MDITQFKGIGKELNAFLSQFDDCFSRNGSRQNLRAYVNGQLSNLPRKSIEPIALAADMLPRTLQCFLSILPWGKQSSLKSSCFPFLSLRARRSRRLKTSVKNFFVLFFFILNFFHSNLFRISSFGFRVFPLPSLPF